jgi:hypothetical protein
MVLHLLMHILKHVSGYTLAERTHNTSICIALQIYLILRMDLWDPPTWWRSCFKRLGQRPCSELWQHWARWHHTDNVTGSNDAKSKNRSHTPVGQWHPSREVPSPLCSNEQPVHKPQTSNPSIPPPIDSL